MHILTLNSGSSSIKFAVFELPSPTPLWFGLAEGLNTGSPQLHTYFSGAPKQSQTLSKSDYASVIETIFEAYHATINAPLAAIGHRVVHGGEQFKTPVRLTDAVIRDIEICTPLAPLHNPANLLGIRAAQAAFPNIPHVAVFDTAFHQTLPPYAYLYALPYAHYETHHVRRYGFHGTSHQYVASVAEKNLNLTPNTGNFITAHLGNGCSVCAIKAGKSLDTSMGMTPLEGLVMGTRSGDIDAGIIPYLASQLKTTPDAIITLLNKESGLLGISGLSADMRTLEAAHDSPTAQLAIEVFCYRLAKYIASYLVPLTTVDALIFTGGIGENSVMIRKKVLHWLKGLNYQVDMAANQTHGVDQQGLITRPDTPIALVIPTNEELMIASLTQATLNA